MLTALRVRARYWGPCLGLLLLVSVPIAWSLHWQFGAYRKQMRAGEALRLLTLSLHGYELVSGERGRATALLGNVAASEFSEKTSALDEARQRTDQELADLVRTLDALRCERCPGMVRSVATARAALAGGREQVDQIRDGTLSGRAPGVIGRAVEQMMAATQPFTSILNDSTLMVAEVNGDVMEPVMLARAAADLREHAGGLGAMLTEPLAWGHPMTPRDREEIAVMEGRVAQLRDLLVARIASMSGVPELERDSTDMLARYFEGAHAYAERVRTACAAGGCVAPSPAQFADRYASGMASILAFRDRALHVATARLDQMQGALHIEIAALLLVDAVILGVLGWAMFAFSGRYVVAADSLAAVLQLLGIPGRFLPGTQREDMLSSLSHDMRVPASAIITLLDMARTTRMYQDSPDLFAKIEDYARRTLQMADDFIRLSQLQFLKYEPAAVDFYGVLLDACDALAPKAMARAITVSIHDTEPQSFVVRAERELLLRAVINLIDNAIKFSPARHPVRCRIQRCPHGLALIVADSGPGIRSQDMPFLFERFRRFPVPGLGTTAPGSGLGLPFVRAVVRRAGGRITCKSTVGCGSEFTIVLPRAD